MSVLRASSTSAGRPSRRKTATGPNSMPLSRVSLAEEQIARSHINGCVMLRAQISCHVSVTRLRQAIPRCWARQALVCPGSEYRRQVAWFSKAYSRERATATVRWKPPRIRSRPWCVRPSVWYSAAAARGFAHIGVLRVLEAHGIVPDVIVGTSIGAVVGGCHAAKELENLESWSRTLTVRGVLSYLDISLSGSGLIGGGHLAARLEAGLKESRIEDLPIRFAAIATEFNTGHEIWLTHGRLSEALRASYSLPGIFPPVRIGGRWLVDGALVNPVPVS